MLTMWSLNSGQGNWKWFNMVERRKNLAEELPECPTLKFLPCKADGWTVDEQTNLTDDTDPCVVYMDKKPKQTKRNKRDPPETVTNETKHSSREMAYTESLHLSSQHQEGHGPEECRTWPSRQYALLQCYSTAPNAKYQMEQNHKQHQQLVICSWEFQRGAVILSFAVSEPAFHLYGCHILASGLAQSEDQLWWLFY